MKKSGKNLDLTDTQKANHKLEKVYTQFKQKSFFNKIVLILFFTLTCFASKGNAQNYRISLLTCDPGEELYSSFGHSALRVHDLDTGKDIIFNWGTFDFDDPGFYLKFTQGRLDYFLSLSTYNTFVYHYQYFQRGIREQVLNLSPEQVNRAVLLMNENAKPENIHYRYDFFYDNCSTRIRDIMEAILGDQLDWNHPEEADDKTFRDLIDEYVYRLPWADFGIDLALGSVIDVEASEREKQFLPEYLEAAFARAEIVGDGPTRLLAQPAQPILDYPLPPYEGDIFNPSIIFWLLAIVFIALTFFGYKKQKLYLGFDIALFAILGLIGVLITFLWFFTEHTTTINNWNILWAFPLHLMLSYGLSLKRPAPWVRQYLMAALILADAAVVFWIFGWQSFHPAILPILLIIILRTNYLYYNLERIKFMER